MSYGIKILTQNGFTELLGFRSAQRFSDYTALSASGSVATPSGVTPSNGGVLIEVNDGKEPPQCAIQSSGNTVWTNYAPSAQQSTNFKIIWLKFK